MLDIETVAVLGEGDEAHACAILASLAGCAVRLHVADPARLDRAFEAIRFRVDVAIERGLLTRTDRQRILDGVLVTPDLPEAVTGADLVIEQDLPPGAASRLPGIGGLVRATAALAAGGPATAEAVARSIAQPGRVLALTVDRSSGFSRLRVLAAPQTSAHTLAAVERFAGRVNARGRHER
jgi:hypothetical protein